MPVPHRRVTLNVALWIAAVPVALAGIRIFMFSRGDTTILRVLLETLQIVPVLTATALLLLPWAYFIAGAILLMNKSIRTALWTMPRRRIVILGFFVVGIAVLYTATVTWAVTIAVIYLLVLLVAILGTSEKAWAKRVVAITNILDSEDLPQTIVSVAVIPLLISNLSGWGTFWLPREAIIIDSKLYDGYVLSEHAEWTTILTTDRAVLRVPSPDIDERLICDQGTVRTLHNISLPVPQDLPQCARLSS